MNANLAAVLTGPAARPDATALTYQARSISYAELEQSARGMAALLDGYGVGPGDRVALLLPNAPSFVAAYFGALWVGAIAVPLNILLRAREIEERLTVAAPVVLVTDDERVAELGKAAGQASIIVVDPSAQGHDDPRAGFPGPVARSREDAAVILFTSGTTGASKGAILTHGGLGDAARNAADALAFGPDDVVLGAAPFSHVLGQSTGLVATLASGGSIAVVPRFEPVETLALMTHTGTTILLGVPTMAIALCEAARSAATLPPVRIAHVGGAPTPVEVTREFERVFGADVYEGYGLTEISGIAATYRVGQPRKPGSVGMPLGDTELRIVSPAGAALAANEVGEVEFRGSTVIPGYWQGPDQPLVTRPVGGWLSTGDLGYVDDEGYLFLVDRLKEMIIRGGYNVYPREVEEMLYGHDDVLEAAVVGIPHSTLGEEVVALVRLRPGAVADPGVIQGWVRERVAAYKYPRHVVIVDDLPKGPTGKILKLAIDREALTRSLDL